MKGLSFGQAALNPRDTKGAEAPSNEPKLTFRLARGVDDLLQVYAVRAIVFVSEQSCPFAEEFDGNDFTATHVVAYIGDEPVATMRLRFFSEFAKFERVAVRKEFRKHQVAVHMIRYAMDVCARKGYSKIYGHIEKRLMRFWRYFGFVEMAQNDQSERVVFSDREYVVAVCEVDPHPDSISLQSPPYVINRPEGEWDRPGVLDYSSVREAVNA